MTNEEKTKASDELKKEIMSQLKANSEEILKAQKLVLEHKNNVNLMKDELSEKTNLVFA